MRPKEYRIKELLREKDWMERSCPLRRIFIM